MWTQHDAVKGLRDKEVFREKWVWEDKLFSEERGTVRVLSDVGLSMNILNDKNHKREQKISYLTVKTIIQLRGGEKSSTTGSCLALSCTKSWVSTKKKKKLPGALKESLILYAVWHSGESCVSLTASDKIQYHVYRERAEGFILLNLQNIQISGEKVQVKSVKS